MKTAAASVPSNDPPRCPDVSAQATLVSVGDLRAAGDSDTCLRPLGLCELGGSCESCWYRPDHPRFSKTG
jgi:hypothetical protein